MRMHGNLKKRLLSLLLTVVMMIGFVPAAELDAYAAPVYYTVTVTWNGQPVPAATVSGGTTDVVTTPGGVAEVEAEDTVTELTVSAEGYLTKTVAIVAGTTEYQAELTKTLNQYFASATELQYTGLEQALVVVDPSLPSDVQLSYTLDGQPWQGTEVPSAKEIGEYSVTVSASGIGYETFEATYNVSIAAAKLDVVVEEKTGLVYNGKEQELITVIAPVGAQCSYTVNGNAWTGEGVPTAKDAGEYKVAYKITMDNHETVESTADLVCKIAQAVVTMEFAEAYTNKGVSEFNIYDETGKPATADFSAVLILPPTELEGIDITYNSSTGITIDTDGTVTFQKNRSEEAAVPGVYYVTASFQPEGEFAKNYSELELKHYIALCDNSSDLISFAESEIEWELYGDKEVQPVTKKYADDNGEISYSVTDSYGAFSYVEGTGIVADESKLLPIVKAVEGENGYSFTVNAKKAVGELENTEWPDVPGNYPSYAEAEASYTVKLKLPEFSNEEILNAYTLSGNITEGWYNENLLVKAVDGYKIAAAEGEEYKDELTFTDSGEHEIYILDTNKKLASGKVNVISDAQGSVAMIDTSKPFDMIVEYLDAAWPETLGQVASLNIFKPNITVQVQAKDEHSGVEKFEWVYKKAFGTHNPDEGSYDSDLKAQKGELTVLSTVEGEGNELVRKATLELNAKQFQQLKGNLSFTAFDKAGNFTDEVKNYIVYVSAEQEKTEYDDNITVVIDDIKPVLSNAAASGELQLSDTDTDKDYYNSDVSFGFTIEEVNFDKADVAVMVTRDNEDYSVSTAWTDEEKTETTQTEPVEEIEYSLHHAEFALSEDGAYTIAVGGMLEGGKTSDNYKDFAGNEMDAYSYEKTVVIDKTAPVVSLTVSADGGEFKQHGTTNYLSGNVVFNISIEEVNFFGDKVEINCTKDGEPYSGGTLSSWSSEANIHKASYTVEEEGVYVLTVSYTDPCKYSGSASSADLGSYVIDKTGPAVTVAYDSAAGTDKQYYSVAQRVASVSVVETNFDNSIALADFVTAVDVDGNAVAFDAANVSAWTNNEASVSFTEDANYSFVIDADKFRDLAGNSATIEKYEQEFTIDDTLPELTGISYSDPVGSSGGKQKWYDNILQNILVGFWKDKSTVTVNIKEDTAGIKSLTYSYDVAAKTSSKNTSGTETLDAADVKAKRSNGEYEIVFDVPAQFNGHVKIEAIDFCDNKLKDEAYLDNGHRVIVDNIAPNAKVTYSDLSGNGTDGTYYRGPIGVNIAVDEANFFSDDVKVTVNNSAQGVDWKTINADNNEGSFTISADGEYNVGITYTDRSGNKMTDYMSSRMVIDTQIEKPVIEVNGENCNGKAYKDDAMVTVSYFDEHFESIDIKILRTSKNNKDVDVSDIFLTGNIENDAEGGFASFEIPKEELNDGLYTITAIIVDKSGNTDSTSVSFTINRFGSVYEYDSYLIEIISDGGKFLKSVEKDLVIVEYNADQLVEGSAMVHITRDGKPIDNVIFEVSPSVNTRVERGESGWYEYVYTISRDNFKEDGFYKVYISSKDAAGNSPESSDMLIQFYVDSTAPELTSVAGLEKAIVDAEQLTVKFSVFDTIGLKSIKIYVDGKLIGKEITDFTDRNNYDGQFVIYESVRAQNVRIVLEDLAGNITDTAAEGFTSAYIMEKDVTVTTNIFARFYANKPLFWGCIAGVVIAAALVGILVPIARRKKEREQAKH